MSDSDSTASPLQQSLTKLHAQLSATSKVDEASRGLLSELLVDIERLLHDPKPAAAVHTPKLEALAVQFDSRHPTLSASLREFVDLLGRAGL